MPHMRVSGQQRGRAKQLRQTMTHAETLLWRYIKAHRIECLGFRRQVPMGIYVADFVCHAAKLVVELDGESHDVLSRQRRDQTRDTWLTSQGYRVLRFTNDQVLRNLEGVVAVISETAGAAMRGAPPSLSLPHKGGGNPQTETVQRDERSRASFACGEGGDRGPLGERSS